MVAIAAHDVPKWYDVHFIFRLVRSCVAILVCAAVFVSDPGLRHRG
jgi:hypothetical protein